MTDLYLPLWIIWYLTLMVLFKNTDYKYLVRESVTTLLCNFTSIELEALDISLF